MDRTIISYKILNITSLPTDERDSLSEQVEKHIGEGWQPFGSPVVCGSKQDGGFLFAQAMVKYY